MAQPFTGDYKSFEHVLMHEMVHQFQFDIFSRGRAGANLQVLSQVNPPLWFMEGMAEFLSLGHRHPQTDAWLRDAALNGTLPTIRQMTERPYEYFPYRYGFALWQYVATRWGDDVVGAIMNSAPSLGVERSFKRETGTEPRRAVRRVARGDAAAPPAARGRVRPRAQFATPLLTQRRTGGFADLFIAPSLSPDGRLRGVHLVRQLPARRGLPRAVPRRRAHGKRIKRLVQSGNNAKAEELRQLYSQSAFSPDGRLLAVHGAAEGARQAVPARRGDATHHPAASTCRSRACSAPPGRPTAGASRSRGTSAGSPICTSSTWTGGTSASSRAIATPTCSPSGRPTVGRSPS
jgi:hypothetical protein